jgi:gliding motility-associated-like protein
LNNNAVGTSANLSSSFPEPGLQQLVLVAITPQGCRLADTLNFEVEARFALFVPNVFSPNGDDVNDRFLITGAGFREIRMLVYDRWGRQVHNYRGNQPAWDGRNSSGAILPEGVYVYFLEITDLLGTTTQRTGTVTLIR